MRKPLLSLDVDGVFADEDTHLAQTADLVARMAGGTLPSFPPAVRTPEQHWAVITSTGAWWAERPPLFQPDPEEIARLDFVLSAFDVQIVSKREPWLDTITTSWFEQHYPWVLRHVKRIACVGANGSKLGPDLTPDFAIDDSQTQIDAYRAAGVLTVAIRSSRTNPARCEALSVAVCKHVGDAINALRLFCLATGRE